MKTGLKTKAMNSEAPEIKKIRNENEQNNFEAKQNATGFFSVLLKTELFLRIIIWFVFLIFAILFLYKNEYFYSSICLFFLFLSSRNEKIKKLSIGIKNGFKVEFH